MRRGHSGTIRKHHPGSWAHMLPGPRSRLGTQHCLVLFWEVGASGAPVQEAAGLTSGSPGRPHAPEQCTAQSGWRRDQETQKPSSVPAKRRLGQSAWKQPRRPVAKQNLIDKNNLCHNCSFPGGPALPRPRDSAAAAEQFRKWPPGFARPKRAGPRGPCSSLCFRACHGSKHK